MPTHLQQLDGALLLVRLLQGAPLLPEPLRKQPKITPSHGTLGPGCATQPTDKERIQSRFVRGVDGAQTHVLKVSSVAPPYLKYALCLIHPRAEEPFSMVGLGLLGDEEHTLVCIDLGFFKY